MALAPKKWSIANEKASVQSSDGSSLLLWVQLCLAAEEQLLTCLAGRA